MQSIYMLSDEKRKSERIAELIAKNAKYTTEDFGGEGSVMVSTYPKPPVYPKLERPRVFVTKDMIPKIRKTLDDPKYSSLAQMFWRRANTENYTHVILQGIPEHNPPLLPLPKEYTEGEPHPFDGSFLPLDITGTSYNWDGGVIAIIEAKALAFLVTGEELYAREAILYIKNAIKTVRFTKELFGDPFRAFSYMMLVTAEIYDWCNALLTEEDKKQLISGCEHILCALDPENGVYNMTIGFPPSRMSGVSGHGVSVMLGRDYLAMSASIFEDRPDWWEFCAGRFYSEFVPPADIAFKGGFVSQGTSLYCFNKFHTYLSGAWVLKCATGKIPFSENMSRVMTSILAHTLPNGRMFPSGDGGRGDDGAVRHSAHSCMIFSAGLFPDAATTANARYFSNDFTKPEYFVNEVSESMALILMSNAAPEAPDRFSKIPLVNYNPYPFGQMISHNGWGDNGAASYMKIGEFTSANHDHLDAGTFQLYYKGLLLTSSGTYANYGSNHHIFYHQATIAQNGLLIYNPEYHNENANPHGTWEERMAYWYSGGQRYLGEAGTMEKWLGGEYETGRVTGFASDSASADMPPSFAYIAGDITKAYDTERTAEYVERRMLTVYTENKKVPMLFFTYDKLVSKRSEFKKTYLLHPTAEPIVDGNTISFEKHGARLVCTMLKGAEAIEKIGGENKAFLINGVNCDGKENGKALGGNCDKIWGRVEFSAFKDKETDFLAAMAITDSDVGVPQRALLFENEKLCLANLLGVCAAFVKSNKRTSDTLELVSPSKVEKYYVSGLSSGAWEIIADGRSIKEAQVSEDSGLLVFEAREKEITLRKKI